MDLSAYQPKSSSSPSSNAPSSRSTTAPGSNHDMAKIFVGGLSWQTTEETLRYHFEQYGEVVSVEVMRDRNTGDPRGFAFVVFKDDPTVELVMQNLPHEINHKVVDVKRAQARGKLRFAFESMSVLFLLPFVLFLIMNILMIIYNYRTEIKLGMAPPSIHKDGTGGEQQSSRGGGMQHYGKKENNDNNNSMKNNNGSFNNRGATTELTPEQLQNKIFVGGLPLHLTRDGLHEFFTQFGTVVDAIIMMDQAQQRSRGFGFVTFENGSGGAQKAMKSQPIYIDKKYVEIKLATPKGDQQHHGANKSKYQNHATGLRNAAAASMAYQSKGEYAGLAASYGRNGWRAGYGTIAFGSYGWNVVGWENISKAPERSGFSFDLVEKAKQNKGKNNSRKRGGGNSENDDPRVVKKQRQ